MIEILIVISSAILGMICALFIFQVLKKRRYNQLKILGNVKYELSSLYFEKSVALEALNKINQHFDEKKIDEFERDRLSHKYINLLQEYDKHAFQLKPILEIQELYEYRNQLNSILSDYVKKIDDKLTGLGIGIDKSNFENEKKDDGEKGNKENEVDGKNKDNDNDKKHFETYLKQIPSIHDNIKTIKSNNKKENDIFLLADSDNNKLEFGSRIEEGSVETERSINGASTMNSQTSKHTGKSSVPLDSRQSKNGNIDLNEIDKIQQDILNTLKRLGGS